MPKQKVVRYDSIGKVRENSIEFIFDSRKVNIPVSQIFNENEIDWDNPEEYGELTIPSWLMYRESLDEYIIED